MKCSVCGWKMYVNMDGFKCCPNPECLSNVATVPAGNTTSNSKALLTVLAVLASATATTLLLTVFAI